MGALGDRFTDVDQAKALYRDYFRDDESVAILYDVIFPIEGFMANRFSSEMRDSLDIIWDSLDAGDSAAVACEKAGLALQNAINDLFGY